MLFIIFGANSLANREVSWTKSRYINCFRRIRPIHESHCYSIIWSIPSAKSDNAQNVFFGAWSTPLSNLRTSS